MAMENQKNTNDKRLHALTREMRFLSSELATLQEEASTPETQRDTERLTSLLEVCCQQWQFQLAQADNASAEARKHTRPEETQHLAATFKETVVSLANQTACSPEYLWVEYQSLVGEGYDNPLMELAQTYREELLIRLLDKSGFLPNQLNELQDSYLSAHASQRVREAIQLAGKTQKGRIHASLGHL